MRTFLIGDIHSNLEALNAVFSDMKEHYDPLFFKTPGNGNDILVNLGDLVGYMPNPNEVIDSVYTLADFNLPGNHDIAANNGDLLKFNPDAKIAMEWTREILNTKSKKILASLVNSGRNFVKEKDMMFAHSNTLNPDDMMIYLSCKRDALFTFFENSDLNGITAFVAHSHRPQIYSSREDKPTGGSIWGGEVRVFTLGKRSVTTYDLNNEKRSLIVIPSVGQPRDNCPLAGYAVYSDNERKIDFIRVEYNFLITQFKMKSYNFPPKLIDRIKFGK